MIRTRSPRPAPVRSRSSIPRPSFGAALAALVAGALLLPGCTIPKREGSSVDWDSSPRLEELSPVDIALPPVRNMSGNEGLPSDALRRAFQTQLVRRRYSPLALDFVDARVVEAGYRPGSRGEDAVLEIGVEEWDDRLLRGHGRVAVTLRARLVEVGGQGETLWSGAVEQQIFDHGTDQADFEGDQAGFVRFLCEEIAREVLAALPSRTPRPGS